ncbi:MAG: biopolymer transporter ExbD [Candidatus Omnitrophica bacterium]|nr:biopolymer transporter ExbD [Candidatus Omnitrophota bacterium]
MLPSDARLTLEMENGSGSSDSTPLADLMLILLAVQLMVAHAAYTILPGEISLPKSGEQTTRPDHTVSKKVVVGFSEDGSLLWNGEAVESVSDLKNLTEKELDREDSVRFFLAGDRAAPYGLSVEVKSVLWEAGVSEVNEIMEPSR